MAYAHSKNDYGQRHDLVEHLRAVAKLTAAFAEKLEAADAGYWLGLWHDLGKFHPEFQRYLELCERPNPPRRGPDHKGAGASLAARRLGPLGLLVQGHHGGLKELRGFRGWLGEKDSPAAQEALSLARAAMADMEPADPVPLPEGRLQNRHAAEMFLRLLFSALVDADFLDTERHFSEGVTAARAASVTMSELWSRFAANQGALMGKLTRVGQVRDEVYGHCIAAAEQPTGVFKLTVPTGGGKTRSAMAFALRHAVKHGLERVIVAVPFISITEQTAKEYRGIFQPAGTAPVVLEHHSMFQGPAEDDEEAFESSAIWAKLAAENWDAPIVVTTTVQLFESLFGNRTSTSRKLHRLARSVIILDEAQSLPARLLTPILDGLRDLATNYGTTVVLSTATQPAFDAIKVFAEVPATEIVSEPERYFAALRRVRYEWRTDRTTSWVEAAGLMRRETASLAVLNTKAAALSLLDALGDPEALHLSTLLCGAHRHAVIDEVKRRLDAGEPCRLVTTQVIEAGVDLDFPLVLRALGPMDSIIQAAGRCNREGSLLEGRVIVFEPENAPLPSEPSYRIGANQTRALRQSAAFAGRELDLDDPAVAREYFSLVFTALGDSGTDRDGIQATRAVADFPETARRFRMIDDDTEGVIVTDYGDEEEKARVQSLVDKVKAGGPGLRQVLRQLQPYTVSLRRREANRYRQFIDPLLPSGGLGVWMGKYDIVRGLIGDDVDALVV